MTRKLAIGGATGFVGAEVLRQALRSDTITSVVAIGRREAPVPEGHDGSKLTNVVLEDLTQYTDEAKKSLADVDACIWTIAITPTKSRSGGFPFEEVRKVSQDYAMASVKALLEARSAEHRAKGPLRYVYFSGVAAERDQTKKPRLMAEYALMRGEAENMLLKFAAESQNAVEVCCAKPGLIMGPKFFGRGVVSSVTNAVSVPTVKVEECAAATLKQCIEGIEKEPLENADIVAIGSAYMEKQK